MKKLVIICILAFSAYQLKAQQLQVKPADILAQSIDKSIQDQMDSWTSLRSTLKPYQTLAVNQNKFSLPDFKNDLIHENMPVVVLEGNSKMPVAKFNGLSKMPIARFETFDNTALKKQKLAVSY